MPDEEIDKLVRDAASQHHPPYDDTAWGKMEVLLDKDLPQKKDRRKPIIFLLSFLVLGGAAYWGIQQANHNNNTINNSHNTAPVAVNTPANNTNSLPGTPADNVTADNSTVTGSKTSGSSQPAGNTITADQISAGTSGNTSVTGVTKSNTVTLNRQSSTVSGAGDDHAITYQVLKNTGIKKAAQPLR